MKRNELHNDTARLLVEIDKWLTHETSNSQIPLLKTRFLVKNILTRGYYSLDEQEILNELRKHYIQTKRNKRLH